MARADQACAVRLGQGFNRVAAQAARPELLSPAGATALRLSGVPQGGFITA